MKDIDRVTSIFERAMQINFNDSSRFVLMSDCHRGDGTWADDFSKNQNLQYAALNHYYRENYTYVEIGDGDELWKNKKFSDIIRIHSDIFWLMTNFYKENRLYFIFGNHDLVKKDTRFAVKNYFNYFDTRKKTFFPLFEGVKIHESIVLNHELTGEKIFLIHGHQVDYINDKLWKLSRFLVNHLWKHLELFGVNDPTSAAKNYDKKDAVDKKLIEWVKINKHMLIAGHTHRPMYPEIGEPPYFNDGSCVHPRCITAIEIADGSIVLVKWVVKTQKNGSLYIGREIIAGPKNIHAYFISENDAINGELTF